MKILAGLASLPILGRFFDVAQVAEKIAPVVKETLAGAPEHFLKLVAKIKALGNNFKNMDHNLEKCYIIQRL
jgi:hypothetical protein